jgi:hypothetical protein
MANLLQTAVDKTPTSTAILMGNADSEAHRNSCRTFFGLRLIQRAIPP